MSVRERNKEKENKKHRKSFVLKRESNIIRSKINRET